MAFRQAVALVFLAAVAAGISQAVRPQPLPWRQDWSNFVELNSKGAGVPVVSLDEARRIVESGTHIILDARPPADFAAGHLAGAFSVPSEEMEKYLPAVMPMLTREQAIMTYCSGHECDESLKLSQHLLQNGFTNVVLFVGGFTDWTAAKLPVEK
jgi:rhodanese-related sulfurtransferase